MGRKKTASKRGKSAGRKAQSSEEEFLATYDPTIFDRPSLAVDVVLLSVFDDTLATLLVRRDDHPFAGAAALPGGFVGKEESLEAAAKRVLREKAGLSDVFLEQLYTFGAPGRDPRTRVVSVAYYALIDRQRFEAIDAQAHPIAPSRLRVPWAGETGGPVEAMDNEGQPLPLAFDHEDVIGMAVKRIRGKLAYTSVGFQLLPPSFTLKQLQHVHEVVLGRPLNKDSLRRKILASGDLEATGDRQSEVDHRPAALYRFRLRSAI